MPLDLLTAEEAASSLLRRLPNAPDLVLHHPRALISDTQGGGASIATYRNGYAAGLGVGAQNEAGVPILTQMKCFSGPSNGYCAALTIPFWGPSFGLAWTRWAQGYGICASIDRVPYRVPYSQMRTTAGLVTTSDQAMALLADDLHRGAHVARVFLVADAIGSVVRQIDLTGILVDRSAGYVEAPHYAGFVTTALVGGAGAAALVRGPSGSLSVARGVTEIAVTNTDAAGTNRVTITNPAGQIFPLDCEAAGTPGDHQVWSHDWPGLTMDSDWTIQAERNGYYTTEYTV